MRFACVAIGHIAVDYARAREMWLSSATFELVEEKCILALEYKVWMTAVLCEGGWWDIRDLTEILPCPWKESYALLL